MTLILGHPDPEPAEREGTAFFLPFFALLNCSLFSVRCSFIFSPPAGSMGPPKKRRQENYPENSERTDMNSLTVVTVAEPPLYRKASPHSIQAPGRQARNETAHMLTAFAGDHY